MTRFLRAAVAVAVFLQMGSIGLLACDTPVYRYAMYRWEPAPYEVYYFHDAEIAPEVEKLHQQIEAASRDEQRPANVILIPAHVKDDPELRRIPPDVRKMWTEQEDPEVPVYMIVSPHGNRLHQGELDEALLKSLIDSPAREEIGKQLEKGVAGVMLLLTGSDAKANREAKQVVQKLQKDIAEGKIELYLPPTFAFPGEEAPEPPKIEIGFHELKRDAKAERWLVESLLSIESDLKDDEFKDQPMIFCVFGRGRALPPFIGKGINEDNLLNCVDFITGACSCTVKDQNPGLDLLFAKDWWTAAENLANAFGAEEGNEPQYGADQVFPDLIIPTDAGGGDPGEMAEEAEEAGEAAAAGGDDAADAAPASDPGGEPADPAPETPVEASEAADDAEETTARGPAEGSASTPQTATVAAEAEGRTERSAADGPLLASRPAEENPQTESAAAGEAEQSGGLTSVFAVGAGLAVALVLLLGLTFVVLRPK